MAAGLGFKDFVTGEVLTAGDVDGYLMQGVWVFADAAARTAAVTSPQEGNMSFLKDTNSTEYYSGSAWAAVGGGGGMTLISTTTLTGASTTLSSIPQTYNYLYLVIFGVTNATANGSLRIDANGSNILGQVWGRSDPTTVNVSLDDRIYAGQATNGDILRTSADNVFLTRIYNYTSTTNFKNFDTVGYFINGSSVKTPGAAWGGLSTNSAITSIVLRQSGGNFSTGTALLYGVK
jgi:hypothetical protein